VNAASGDFFERKREWSRRKHEVLEGYVPQFSRILGRDRGSVYFVDGFAGRGYYGSEDDREDGSPLVRSIDASSAMKPGDANTVTLTAHGKPGGMAENWATPRVEAAGRGPSGPLARSQRWRLVLCSI
jgi:hypothetical protein